jgi:hypothetical protein
MKFLLIFSHVMSPSSIAAEIRSINPSFRSYTQQVGFLERKIFFKIFILFEGCSRISSMFYG